MQKNLSRKCNNENRSKNNIFSNRAMHNESSITFPEKRSIFMQEIIQPRYSPLR